MPWACGLAPRQTQVQGDFLCRAPYMLKRLNRLSGILLGLLLVLPTQARVQGTDSPDLISNDRLEKVAVIVTRVVERYHYKKPPLDDELSKKILDRYLESLDPNRLFFLQADVDKFAVYRTQLDDLLGRGNINPAFDIFRQYRKRVDERVALALKLVDKDMEFTKDEDFLFDRAKAPWAKSATDMDEIWRKRVKNDYLSLKLTDKEDADIRDTLRRRYQGIKRRISQFKTEDVFSTYVNAYALSLDPHSNFMSPSSSENFDISMRLSLEGIGAVLRSENEYTIVQKTLPGGPAQLSSQVDAGDKVVGVAQGLDGAMEDVIGWRLQDVVDKIRGPKGSVVRLELIPKSAASGGKHRLVTLVRNNIKLEEQAAKTMVVSGLPGMGSLKIGVVEIHAFYRDFGGESRGEAEFRSTTRDVRRLLKELVAEGVDGVVIDLRENGGGSLSEATELTGLFIDQGPVVQVKDSLGKIEVEKDPDPDQAYAGPLAVLVDRTSASASEIFAAAIQDYRRGIIIGEPTFGKGTVQTLVDLNRFVANSGDDLGRLRLTMAQFFRINGGSTQHKGVEPDIRFPTAGLGPEHGERSLDNALPWSQIKAAPFTPKGPVLEYLAKLREKSAARVQQDSGFAMLVQQERLLQEADAIKTTSLNEVKRRKENDQRDKVLKDSRNAYLRSQGIVPAKENADPDSEAEEKEAKAIAKIQLLEAARIMADSLAQQQEQARMAGKN